MGHDGVDGGAKGVVLFLSSLQDCIDIGAIANVKKPNIRISCLLASPFKHPIISCGQPQPNASRPFSQQDILDDIPMYIGQSNVTTTEAVGQLLVVDPEQVQNGGVEIVYL